MHGGDIVLLGDQRAMASALRSVSSISVPWGPTSTMNWGRVASGKKLLEVNWKPQAEATNTATTGHDDVAQLQTGTENFSNPVKGVSKASPSY